MQAYAIMAAAILLMRGFSGIDKSLFPLLVGAVSGQD